MREIKFRGREVDTGRVVYGYYLESATTSWIRDNETKTYVQVDSETVAQLIGHDSQGREVYEGDELAGDNGNSYIAVLETCVEWKNDSNDSIFRRMPIKFAQKCTKLTLVEAVA